MKLAKLSSGVLILLGFSALYFLRNCDPVFKLFAASVGMIWIIKLAALVWQKADGCQFRSKLGVFLFLTIWPGISVEGFTQRCAVPLNTGSRFFESWLTFLSGTVLLLCVSTIGKGESTLLNYVGLASILLIVHLGLLEVIADAIRLFGFSPKSLFDRPYLATSLHDFWSTRWNRAFVAMNKLFILRPLRDILPLPLLTFSIFLVSGLLHELGISYPVGRSWGYPLLYFVIQGGGMLAERFKKVPRLIVWLWILLPLPLLFTPSFTDLFLGSAERGIYQLVSGLKLGQLYKFGLILGGACHCMVLCASVQVPGKLGWRADFQKLTSMNRKVFWTYGAYIFSIILFMSLVSFLLAGALLETLNRASFFWTLFIALFWWARVLTDFFYMNHTDWPQGPLFTIGHICLTTLFLSMAALYTLLSVVTYGALR